MRTQKQSPQIVTPSTRQWKIIGILFVGGITTLTTLTAGENEGPWNGFKYGLLGSAGILAILWLNARWIYGGVCGRCIAWFSRLIGMPSRVEFDIENWGATNPTVYKTTPLDASTLRWWKRAILVLFSDIIMVGGALSISAVIVLIIYLVGASSSIAEFRINAAELFAYVGALLLRVVS